MIDLSHLKGYIIIPMKVDSNKPSRMGVLLQGLSSIRKALGLRQDQFAEEAGIHQTHLSRLENLKQGASEYTLTALAGKLSCQTADLLSVPSTVRLAQIVADYDEAKAKRSRATALKLEKKARAS